MRALGLIGVLTGLTGAVLYLAAAGGAPAAPVLMGLGPLPFFIAVLGWGNRAGLIAGATALAIVLVVTTLAPGLGMGLALVRTLAFALSSVAPALWLSHLALLRRQADAADSASPVEWYPLGRLVLWLAGMACGGYLAVEILAYAASGTSLPGVIAAYLDQAFPQEARDQLMAQFKASSWEPLLSLIAHMLPAMSGIFWQIWMVANGIAGFSLLAATGRCPRPRTGWQTLALPRAYAVPFLLCLALALASAEARYWALTLTALLFVPYFLLGLAVLHAIPLKGPGRVALLGLFYFLLLLLAWPAIPVGAVGFVEQWSGLRARLRGPPTGG